MPLADGSTVRRSARARASVSPHRALDGNLTAANIQNLGRPQLLKLRQQLGLGSDWNTLLMPEDWFAPGGSQTAARTTIRARLNAPGRAKADLELAMLRANQFLIICFVTPTSSGRGSRMLSIGTIVSALCDFLAVAVVAMSRPPRNADRLFDRLRSEDLINPRMRGVTKRLRILAARGHWSDTVDPKVDYSLEKSRRGPPRDDQPPAEPQPIRPLPDEFIAQAGWRLIWITQTLGPALVECARGVAQQFMECESRLVQWKRITNKRAVRGRKPVPATTVIRKYIDQFEWRQPDGNPISELPFQLYDMGGDSWPPRGWIQVKELIKALQTAHLFIFLMSTGGRISEALSLRGGCIVEGQDGIYTANGRSYKLVFSNNGATRDWPVPQLAVQAIRQQELLSSAIESIGAMDLSHAMKRNRASTQSIWKSVGAQGKGFKASYNHSMRRTMDVLGLSSWMDDDALSAHRFRKTIARLIALAMVGAPKILMDLFGHKSIEMTLHYILTDPHIRSEMAEVAQAQTIMLAQDAIQNTSDLGGPAAAAVQTAVHAERVRLGRDFGEEDLHRLAETLTFSGKVWQLVRPGVICTKGPQQSGPCNHSLGYPEPSRCRSACQHRLEQAFLRDDIDKAIGEAVAFLEAAQSADDAIAVEMWQGQILSHLPRFPDLAAKWREHPTVACLEGL